MYYNSYALTREMNERRIAKLKADLNGLEVCIEACLDADTRKALHRIHGQLNGQIEALQGCNLRRVG
ncbi:hypothetical protein [Dyadobacter psychrotolerans]|uniref:Uncharacterized protein n=1 Tax=Dyadobacter psychrotolerans TaxID=2541721 RepID=A0A4R5DTA5_9BACT|nr:hypothetical protein [Dyadobacter psychrotolerans]TDE17692.1 hypothetical protein E0F88_07325 [Dyadobacter psychrotolerans]